MKTLCILLFTFLLTLGGNSQVIENNETVDQNKSTLKGTIKVLSTPDLYDITNKWAREYGSLNPKLKIKVLSTELIKSDDVLPGGADVSFFSNKNENFSSDENLRKIVVGRDVIVPLISSKNPFRDAIYRQGVSADEIAEALKNPGKSTWGAILGNDVAEHINFYMIDNSSLKSDVADFINEAQVSKEGIEILSEDEMISKIQNDPYAFGFCRMTSILDNSNRNFVENITLLPIDKNGNNVIDYQENIYADYNAFTRGVWIGKYPKSLYRNIYSFSSEKSSSEALVGFLKWIVTDGQTTLTSFGYDDIVYSERKANIDALYISEIKANTGNKFYAGQRLLALIIGLFVATGLIANIIARIVANRQAAVKYVSSIIPSAFDQDSVKVLNGLYFDKTHTWAFMDKNGGVRVGIADFLQHVTGPITRVKLKIPGERIKKGEKIMSIIQKGKQLNIYSPVSGIIREQNTALLGDSSALNLAPYSDGWVYEIEPTNWLKEIQQLFMGNKYQNWLKNEFSRLKDFMAASLSNRTVEHAHLVLQDGGELKDWVLEECGPEVWEDFQTNFIDTNK